MQNRIATSLVTASFLAITAGANAAVVDAIVTADNHYAIYTETDAGASYIGGNELGSGGSPGSYNWSEAETWQFTADSRLFIAAWSDDSIAQGLLADIRVGNDTFHSGDPRWLVFATHENRGDGDAHPTTVEMDTWVSTADTGLLWETPFAGGANGISPWGTVAGISTDARWMWWNTPNDSDPLQGGSGAGELLIFSTEIPAPGAGVMVAMSGIALLRRRR